jgi:WD40 repeat protein
LGVQHHKKGVFDIIHVGAWVFTAGGDGLLTRWDMEQGRTIESLHLSAKGLRCIVWDGIADELIVGASDGSVYGVDVEHLTLSWSLPSAHEPSVFTTALSADGGYLLSGGRDAMLRIWEKKEVWSLKTELAAHWYTLNHVAFSPEGHFFATASRDKTFKIWDAHTFELLKVVDTIRDAGHINSVNRLLWLSDGRLVSVSDDRSAMIWEMK